MAILKRNNQLILAGIEATYGVAEVLAGADAVQCNLELDVMNAQQKRREFSRAEFGALPVIHTEVHRGARLRNLELAGSGDPAVAPAWVPIFRACGWAAVTTPTETTLTPVTDATDSLTIDPMIDGELFQLVGARGKVTMNFQIGEFPFFDAELLGGWVDVATVVSPPTPNYDDWEIPEPVDCDNNTALTLDGQSYPWYELTVNQDSQLEFFCVPGETGSRIEITSREIKGTIKLQAKQVTDHDIFALCRANTPTPFAMTHGTAAGEQIALAAPKLQLTNPRESDYKGDLAWELDFLALPDTGDDEFTVVTS